MSKGTADNIGLVNFRKGNIGIGTMASVIDMLIRIKNAQLAHSERLLVPFSKNNFEIIKILKDKKFIEEIEKKKKKVGRSEHFFLEIKLNQAQPFGNLNLLSRPSRKMYAKSREMGKTFSGYGISIVSTTKGIMTGEDAKKQKLGGELIAEIY